MLARLAARTKNGNRSPEFNHSVAPSPGLTASGNGAPRAKLELAMIDTSMFACAMIVLTTFATTIVELASLADGGGRHWPGPC